MKNVKNKVYAVALFGLSFTLTMLEKDATVLILALFISIPMFFAKGSWID